MTRRRPLLLLALAALVAPSPACAPWRTDGGTRAPPQATLHTELREQLWPLLTIDAEFDIEPLWGMVHAARILGVGEPSRSVLQLQPIVHGLIRRATAEGAPLIVALDIPVEDGPRIDAWVDPSYGTSVEPPLPEEYDELLRSIRAHNRSAASTIRVVGIGTDDYAMATLVERSALAAPGARVLVLSHNRRIDRAPAGPDRSMGTYLARRFGAAYVAVHTTFDRGTELGWRGRRARFAADTGWAPRGTLESDLRARIPIYVLDIRAAAAGRGALARYLAEPRWSRAYPDRWSPGKSAWSQIRPAGGFDVLVYLSSVALAAS